MKRWTVATSRSLLSCAIGIVLLSLGSPALGDPFVCDYLPRTPVGTIIANTAPGLNEASGLVQPLRIEGEERFSAADRDMARSALRILDAGFPLNELLALAVQHARSVQEVSERAIDLFDDYVRKPAVQRGDSAQVTEAFRDLLPQLTRLVALHFQRTVVTGALQRLAGRGDAEDLRAALAATESSNLEIAWR